MSTEFLGEILSMKIVSFIKPFLYPGVSNRSIFLNTITKLNFIFYRDFELCFNST